MLYELVKLKYLSGFKAGIYSIRLHGELTTEFDKFLDEYDNVYPDEMENIVARLEIIGKKVGLLKRFYKEHEGSPGDGVCALFDVPDALFRLYFVRNGTDNIVVGDDGLKTVRAWQEDEKLRRAANMMKELSADMALRFRDKEIYYCNNGVDICGKLKNYEDDDDEY